VERNVEKVRAHLVLYQLFAVEIWDFQRRLMLIENSHSSTKLPRSKYLKKKLILFLSSLMAIFYFVGPFINQLESSVVIF